MILYKRRKKEISQTEEVSMYYVRI